MVNSWKVIITKSDVEPWWFFEDWEKDIVNNWTFTNKNEAVDKFFVELNKHLEKYPSVKQKNYNTIAFWSPEEIVFCEACDDDIQIYHGLILMENDKPMETEGEIAFVKDVDNLVGSSI